MLDDRLARQLQVAIGVEPAQLSSLLDRHLGGHVPDERVVRRRLVGDQVEVLAAPRQLGEHDGCVAEQTDAQRLAGRRCGAHTRERVVEVVRLLVQVPRLQTALDPGRIDLDAQDRGAGKRRRQRLRPAHASQARRQDRATTQVWRAVVRLPRGAEGLVRPLQDPLRADVDPRPRGHLAEHRQPDRLQPPELLPGRPARYEQRVRDQHTRRARVRAKHAHGLARLHQQRLVLAQAEQRPHDPAQRVVRARRAARSPVHDQLLRMLRHLGVEVVEQHPKRRLRLPRQRVQLGPARRANRRQVTAQPLDRRLDITTHGPRSASPRRLGRRSSRGANPLREPPPTPRRRSREVPGGDDG